MGVSVTNAHVVSFTVEWAAVAILVFAAGLPPVRSWVVRTDEGARRAWVVMSLLGPVLGAGLMVLTLWLRLGAATGEVGIALIVLGFFCLALGVLPVARSEAALLCAVALGLVSIGPRSLVVLQVWPWIDLAALAAFVLAWRIYGREGG